MADALIVRLLPTVTGAERGAAEWLFVDSAGVAQGTVYSGTLAEAAAVSADHKVTLLVPGTDVLLAEPVLPVKSAAKQLQVVPFALEEQLASDVEDLHFALGKRIDDRPGTPVAVVARDHLDAWLASALLAGLQVESVYAETALLPTTPAGVTLLIESSRVYVLREGTTGAVLDVEPLIEGLQLALAAGEEAREHVTIYLTEDVYEHERDLLEGLREFTASLQLKLLPDGALPLLAAGTVQKGPVNLLQGSYTVKKKVRISFQPWRYAAILAGVFVTMHLGLTGWKLVDLKRSEKQADENIVQMYQLAMPGLPVPETAAIRKQLEMRLDALRGSSPASGIMVSFATLSEAMAQAPGTSIEAFAFRDNITDLRLLVPSVDALDKIQHVSVEKGMSAQIQSATPRDSKIEGRLQLKRAGA